MKSRYAEVTAEVVEALGQIVGRDGVSTQRDEVEKYACDEMPMPKPHPAEVVVKPRDASSVARVLGFANDRRIPVTPRGSGTGVCGGCVPVYGGILLSLERMNAVLEVDEANLVATVEPGVTLGQLYDEVGKHGLYYPLYPGESTASIGGNVATNAGGMNAVKHGVTRHRVLGLDAVLASGRTISVGGKFVKSSSGYDLTQLLVGSEGTLAVITRVMLRLSTPPGRREVLLVPFSSLDNAIEAVPDIMRQGVTPTGIEFMEQDIISIVEQYLDWEMPLHGYEAFLMIILEGETEEETCAAAARIEEACVRNGAVGSYVPASEGAKRRLLEARERFYPAVKRLGPLELADVVVPRSSIPDFVKGARRLCSQLGLPVLAYGHAGDGNVHLHFMQKDMDRKEWQERLPKVLESVYRLGWSLGGLVSGEHGLGFDKKGYLAMTADGEVMELRCWTWNRCTVRLARRPGLRQQVT